MEKKNLFDLIDALQTLITEARENNDLFVKTFFKTIVKGLEKDKYVKVKGFGTFKVISVSPRESVDINSGERIEIKGHSKITFTPDAEVREVVNSPFAHLQSVVINEGTDISQMDTTDNEAIDEIHKGMQTETNEVSGEEEPTEKVEEISDNVDEQKPNEDVVTEDSQEQEGVSEDAVSVEESINTEVGEESDTDNDEAVARKEENNKRKFVVAITVTAILGFAVGFLVAEFVPNFHGQNEAISSVATPPTAKIKVVKPKAAVRTMKKDTVVAVEAKKKEIAKAPIMPVEKGDSYAIVGIKTVHELKAGENITRLAKQIYGSKELVKYIIRFNGIENPDMITVGTKLKIPELQPVAKLSKQ